MAITNITEPIRSEACNRLLALCGVRSACQLSDYEYLREIARVLPLLSGHPFADALQDLLDKQMQIKLPLTLETVDQIWTLCAARLMQSELSIPVLSFSAKEDETAMSIELSKQGQVRTININTWTQTATLTWNDWEGELKQRLEALGTEPLVLFLSAPLFERVPSRYHVEQALCGQTDARDAILSAQLLRTLLLWGEAHRHTLLLEVQAGEEACLIRHLEHAESLCALPALILSVSGQASLEQLMPFLSSPRQSNARIGARLNGHHAQILPQLASRYPLGRVFLYALETSQPQYFSVFSAKKA